MSMIIQVAIWSHRQGYSVGTFQTHVGAESWRQEIAADNWEDEMGPIKKPSDPSKAADLYFSDDSLGALGEFFEVLPSALEG